MGHKERGARHALDAVRRSWGQSHVGLARPEVVLESLIRKALGQLLPKSTRAA